MVLGRTFLVGWSIGEGSWVGSAGGCETEASGWGGADLPVVVEVSGSGGVELVVVEGLD